eukprot:scaffold808_cov370-Prasinococcus_capsulatus_cf.AAC.17
MSHKLSCVADEENLHPPGLVRVNPPGRWARVRNNILALSWVPVTHCCTGSCQLQIRLDAYPGSDSLLPMIKPGLELH